MTNAEQFLDYYSSIEQYLRRTYGQNGQFETFLQLVTKAEKSHAVLAFYASDLREYGELRNAIIHKRAPEDNAIIAEPHSFVVERMALIKDRLERPVKIQDVMTKPVFSISLKDDIYATALIMYQNVYTHVPVYDEKEQFVGVLSESAILRWIGHNIREDGEFVVNTKHKLADMINWLDESGNKFNDYEFVPAQMGVLDVRRRFEQALQEGRRLGAIFVTKTGKSTESIMGMVTAWDLPRLTLE